MITLRNREKNTRLFRPVQRHVGGLAHKLQGHHKEPAEIDLHGGIPSVISSCSCVNRCRKNLGSTNTTAHTTREKPIPAAVMKRIAVRTLL